MWVWLRTWHSGGGITRVEAGDALVFGTQFAGLYMDFRRARLPGEVPAALKWTNFDPKSSRTDFWKLSVSS